MSVLSTLLAVTCAVTLSEARRWSLGPSGGNCSSEATAVAPFDLSEYLGVWYQISVNGRFAAEEGVNAECVYANYSLNSDGTVRVDNEEYKNGEWSSGIGTAKQPTAGVGQLYVSFDSEHYGSYRIIELLSNDQGYYVSLVWSCEDKRSMFQDLWVLSRDTQISSDTYDSVLQYAESVGIPVSDLNMKLTPQGGDCPY